MAKGLEQVSPYHLKKFQQMYADIIALAHQECPADPLPPKNSIEAKKELPLIKRLESLESNVTLFVRNFDVPFDNNEAERAIRCVRIKTKSAGCFRGKILTCTWCLSMVPYSLLWMKDEAMMMCERSHKRTLSRKRTPWDEVENRTATQEYLRMHYLTRYEQRHPKRGELDEAVMVNSYVPSRCPFCESTTIIKKGFGNDGVRRYRCLAS